MNSPKRKAPESVQLAEAGNRSTNYQKEEPMNTSLTETTDKQQLSTFDTSMRSTVNHGGDAIITSIGYSTFHGRNDIIVNFVNRYGEVIYLDTAGKPSHYYPERDSASGAVMCEPILL